jgi:tetratricopeptide (TPR) repeat protein
MGGIKNGMAKKQRRRSRSTKPRDDGIALPRKGGEAYLGVRLAPGVSLPVLPGTPKRSRRFLEAINRRDRGETRTAFIGPQILARSLPMSSRLDFVTSVGHFLVGLGLNDLAERYFRHALTLVPDRRSTQALLLLDYMATTFALRQLDREAIELWREVVGTSPREDDLETSTIFVSALLGKGRAHGRLGERRQALRAFHDGLAAIGPHSSLLELKGKLQHEVAFRHHSDGQYSEAVAMFRLALATKNSVPNIDRHSLLSTRMMLGLALNQAEQQDDAASVLESVVRSPPGSEVDDLRLIAISALATAKHGRGDNAAALRLISAGKMITPTNDRGRQQLLGLELLEIKAGTAGATQRGLLRSLINRIDQAGRPHYAIPIYVQAQMGLLETYLDEGDQEGARRHLDAVLPIIPEIERERVEPVETLEIFKKFGQQVHDPSAPLSGLFKANRFRRAFSDDPPLIFGTWLPQELQNDFSVADHMFSQSLTRLAAELPHFPPIEFHFLHNDADTRASIKLYKDRFLVGIRSGAIRRIGDTLDAIVRSPEILSRWKLDFVLTGRVLVIDEGEVFMLDGKRLDPLRKDIRQTLLMISLDYLFCHELAHALNGHLGLIKKDGVSNLVRHTLEMNRPNRQGPSFRLRPAPCTRGC